MPMRGQQSNHPKKNRCSQNRIPHQQINFENRSEELSHDILCILLSIKLQPAYQQIINKQQQQQPLQELSSMSFPTSENQAPLRNEILLSDSTLRMAEELERLRQRDYHHQGTAFSSLNSSSSTHHSQQQQQRPRIDKATRRPFGDITTCFNQRVAVPVYP